MKRRTFIGMSGTTIASVSGCTLKESNNTGYMVHVGFGSEVVNDTFNPRYPFHDDLETVALFISDGAQKFLLIALDFLELSYRSNLTIRETVSRKTGVPIENIVIHCTHNHSGPTFSQDIGFTLISEKSANAALSAISSARPANMAFAVANVGHRFSIYRRMNFEEGLGTLTFWYGYNYLEDGTADARFLFNERLTRWFGEVPEKFKSNEPLINRGPVDELLQILAFKDSKTGKVLGSLLRFAAHVQLASCASKWQHSTDVPGYARKRLREILGGDALFINGPCGDLVPKEFTKFNVDPGKFNWAATPLGPTGELSCINDSIMRTILENEGKEMADRAINALNAKPFIPLSTFNAVSSKEYMPLREDMPDTSGGYDEVKRKAMDAYKRALTSNAPAGTIKKLAEAYNRAHFMKDRIEISRLITDDELKRREIPYELQTLLLNDVILVGLPGEVVKDTGDYLRANLCGEKLITMTECNADIGYVATREMFPFGSYEVNNGVQHISGEQKLREAARDLVLSL